MMSLPVRELVSVTDHDDLKANAVVGKLGYDAVEVRC